MPNFFPDLLTRPFWLFSLYFYWICVKLLNHIVRDAAIEKISLYRSKKNLKIHIKPRKKKLKRQKSKSPRKIWPAEVHPVFRRDSFLVSLWKTRLKATQKWGWLDGASSARQT